MTKPKYIIKLKLNFAPLAGEKGSKIYRTPVCILEPACRNDWIF